MDNRLIAIGDIHGCYDPLRELIEKELKIRQGDRIIFLGDYIDRGPMSREVIDYLLSLQGSGFDIIPLIGNHESMLLDSVKDERFLSTWFMNGGYETLFSFGVESADELDGRYLYFFRNLPYYFSQEQFIFVHAGFNDEISDPYEDRHQMIWSRRERYSNPVFDGRIIVHGHTPVPISTCREMTRSGSSVINIDTGCVYGGSGGYGYLTAIELLTGELFSVKA